VSISRAVRRRASVTLSAWEKAEGERDFKETKMQTGVEP